MKMNLDLMEFLVEIIYLIVIIIIIIIIITTIIIIITDRHKTYRHMKVRISEHQGVSPRTGKRVKGTLSTSVRDHMLNCNHTVAWEDFSIIGRESNHYLLETKESLFIKRDKPSLNRNKYSQELFLF